MTKVPSTWAGKAPKGAAKADARPGFSDPTGCYNPWWLFQPNQTIRSTACDTERYTIGLIKIVDGIPFPVGEAVFTTKSVTRLDLDGLKWSESFSVSAANLYGEARTTPISLSLVAITKPNTHGTITGGIGGPFTLSATKPVSGTIQYSSAVSERQVVWDATHYILAGPPPPGFDDPIDLGYTGPEWRCDDQFWSNPKPPKKPRRYRVPGCAFPFHAATDQSNFFASKMYLLPGIRENIQAVQRSSEHPGRPGYGVPLHRTTDEQKDINRSQVCGRLTPPKPGLECDEYPFASVAEGGTFYSPPNRGIAWVPSSEQRKQGGFLGTFYRTNRILPGDPFYVNVFA
ncbi:NucA/NucB deoxyribonuclease domain-containing protein [Streptomyces monashensis]|uniref:Deoxyribonuclease NucA/NucB domain-containing protein n=1 Tax=Streptomyces monashensis TaxID=1678012 RepID=A0A1S2P9R9_9ACTN|nr:NucA/NucB deoxyribonuclease domain-containing protein [Streptomyces monashensis]OIJ90302.1 hypothetical protein BIV23_40725 [Streptomyces monashensis]